MATLNFADRYAEAGLAPSAEIITMRKAPVDRLADDLSADKLFDLVGNYYDSPSLNLMWFRDAFAEDDASFSLVNNERESKVLSAIILGKLVAEHDARAVLAIATGSAGGKRMPKEARWLLSDALSALGSIAVSERRPAHIEVKVTPTAQPKFADEIKAITHNDWATLLATLIKFREESRSSITTVARQSKSILEALNRQVRLQREESQMLWWIIGGHSRSLERPFSSFAPLQAALVAAIDLATLTSVSRVGPVAAPAMLERMIGLGKKPKGAVSFRLEDIVDGLAREDLKRLEIKSDGAPARITPLITAIDLARTIGPGGWRARFAETTGLDASIEFQPLELAEQLYREHLLGQLI